MFLSLLPELDKLMKTRIHNLVSIGIGALILSIVGFFNGYPLVYSDTGTYIYSGFSTFIPRDRPIIYGLFLKYFSLFQSAWFVILTQNLLTAFVLFQLLKMLIEKRVYLKKAYFGIVLFLTLFSGIGWYSNQLMPDFLAPLSILSIFILLKQERFFSPTNLMLMLILIFSSITHFSHLLIGSTLIAAIAFLKLVIRKQLTDISCLRIFSVAAIVFSGWLILPTVNFMVEKKFILSKGSHVFLMAHLNDTGILKKFLDEHCTDEEFKDCKICEFKDSLPVDLASFMWSKQNIVKKTGDWEGSEEEYNKIIHATLKNPKYLFLNCYKSLTYGLIQLTRNGIGQGLTAYNEGSAPYGQIKWRFPSELNNYLNSKQNKWDGVNLNFKLVNVIQLVIIIASLFILIFLFSAHAPSQLSFSTTFFLIFIVGAIVINAFITAGLNSPCERFQARVIWMLPLALIILIINNYSTLKKHFTPDNGA